MNTLPAVLLSAAPVPGLGGRFGAVTRSGKWQGK